MNIQTQYHRYKSDFYSAYRNNGGNAELALVQLNMLYPNVSVERFRLILRPILDKLPTTLP